jgi:exonuclease SbcC
MDCLMALFANFLKPKWQHDDLEVRRKALVELKSTELLLNFIDAESTSELRTAAVRQIQDEQILESLLGHNQADVKEAAREHWLSLLMPEGIELKGLNSPTLIRIAGLTRDPKIRLDAISRIQDQNERLSIAKEHPIAKVRLAAAEGINNPELLHTLQNHAQGKDKAIYRLCKDRLAAHKSEQETRKAQATKIQQLKDNLSQLLRLGYNPEFTGRLQVSRQHADALDALLGDEERSFIQQQLSEAQSILQQHAEEEQRREEQQAQTEQAKKDQTQLLEQLDMMLGRSEDAYLDATGWQQQRQLLDQSWRNSQSAHKADQDQARHFENGMQQILTMSNAASQYLEQKDAIDLWAANEIPDDLKALKSQFSKAVGWEKQLSWPAGFAQPDWLNRITARKQGIQQKLDELKQREDVSLAKVAKLVAQTEELIHGGKVKEANKSYSQLMNTLRTVDGRASQSYQRQAKSLGGRLNEMRDWQGYVTQPKKEALCVSMESLIGADIEPDILADQIQALQDEWKTLNSSRPDKELWTRFQEAGDKAFEPCRAYFGEVAKQRQANVERRNQLIDELTTYESAMDWATADWKVVQKTLDAARDAFRSYSPVDRHAHKDTQQRFRTQCDAIYAHLQGEFDKNLAEKQALVDSAASLIEEPDLSKAIDQVKALQQAWKQVGITPRSADQKLWKAFRQECDSVFQRLDQEKAERRAQVDQLVAAAEDLLTQAQQLVSQDLPVSDAQHQLSELEQAFGELGELPKSAYGRIRKGFAQVADDLIKQQESRRLAAENAKWQGLIDRLDAIATGDEAKWENASEAPKGYAEVLKQGWAQAQAETTDAPSESNINSTEAIDLCIQLEILADTPSPAQDQARRMEIQVQKLAKGLGQFSDSNEERLTLITQWLQLGTTTPELRQRFASALQAGF